MAGFCSAECNAIDDISTELSVCVVSQGLTLDINQLQRRNLYEYTGLIIFKTKQGKSTPLA